MSFMETSRHSPPAMEARDDPQPPDRLRDASPTDGALLGSISRKSRRWETNGLTSSNRLMTLRGGWGEGFGPIL